MALSDRISRASREQLAEDVTFLLEQVFRLDSMDGHEDPTDCDTVTRLVRIAYEEENYTGRPLNPRNAQELASCLQVCRRMPKHRLSPAVEEALREAREHLAQTGDEFRSPIQNLVAGLDAGQRAEMLDRIKPVAERNLGRVLVDLREEVSYYRIDFISVAGDLWMTGLDLVRHYQKADLEHVPRPEGIERVFMKPDGALAVEPWEPADDPDAGHWAGYWDFLFLAATDIACIEHPEMFETDAACSIVLSGLGDSTEDPRTAIVSISFKPLFPEDNEPDGLQQESPPSP